MAGRILFTASTFSHIRNFHLPYLKWFREHGWIVHVACGGERLEIPWAHRVEVLPFQKSMRAPENFRAKTMLRRMAEEERYTLISTHTSLAAFFTRLAVKGMKDRPLVANTVHGYLFDENTPAGKRNVLLAAERLTAKQTDLLMTMNEWDMQLAQRERLGALVARIPGMGVDFTALDCPDGADRPALRRQRGIPEDAFVLIYPAEFSARKSQAVLIRALAHLPERCVLVLPGQGERQEECRALAGQLNLADRVVFPGQVSGMGPWYAASDLAVTASRSEGMPFNVMEAMHAGLPVAASAVKGHTDLVQDGVTGLLYPYGDEDACADAIRRLLDSPALCGEMGRNGRAEAERYRLERVMPQVLRQYARILPELSDGVPEPRPQAERDK